MKRSVPSSLAVLLLLACYMLMPAGAAHAVPPIGTVSINNGAASTSSSLVTLTIDAQDGIVEVCSANYPRICGNVSMQLSSGYYFYGGWQTAVTSVPWLLRGNVVCSRFKNNQGIISDIKCDTIQIVNDTVSISFSEGRSYFSRITDASNNALSGQEISLKAVSFSEDVTLAAAMDVSLVGGYDSTYGVASGISTLNGNIELASDSTVSIANLEIAGTVTISNGTLTTDNVSVI